MTGQECERGTSQGTGVSYFLVGILVIWAYVQFVRIHQDVYLIHMHFSICIFQKSENKRQGERWCERRQFYK